MKKRNSFCCGTSSKFRTCGLVLMAYVQLLRLPSLLVLRILSPAAALHTDIISRNPQLVREYGFYTIKASVFWYFQKVAAETCASSVSGEATT